MAAVPEDQMSDDSYEHIDSPDMDDIMELKDHHDYISLDPDCADDAERVAMLRGFIAQMKVTIGNLQEAGLLARREVIDMDTQLQDRELENEEKEYELGEKDREIALLTEQVANLTKELAEERAERAAERAAAAAAAKVDADAQTDPDVPCPAPAPAESDELAPFLRKVRELNVEGVPAESLAMAAPLQPTATKHWHVYVSNYERQVMVVNLISAIFPSSDPAAMHDHRVKDLCAYARKVETDMFENADDREEYYHLLAVKMMKISRELAEKKKARLAAASAPAAAVVAAAAPAPPPAPLAALPTVPVAPVVAVQQAPPAVPASPASPSPTSSQNSAAETTQAVASPGPAAQPVADPASATAAPQKPRAPSKPRSSVDPDALAAKIRFVKQPGSPSEGFNWPLPHAATASKNWHGAVTMEERRQLIGKIIMSVFPNLFPIFNCENSEKRRINEIIEASRDIEKGYFSAASDQEEYYRLLAEKMLTSQSLMEAKKQRKLKESAAAAAALAAGSARQARNLQQLLLAPSTSQQLGSSAVPRSTQPALIPTPAPLRPPIAAASPAQVMPERKVKKEEIDSKEIKQEPLDSISTVQHKSWHSTISSGLRQQLRTKLALTVLPSDPTAHGCGTSERVAQYAKQGEAEAYWRADSKEQYFRLLAEAIQQSQMDVDEDDEPAQSVGEILEAIRELDADPVKSRIKQGKAWHAGFPAELRNQLCLKLPAMMSPADPDAIIGFARTTESQLFESADSKADYYRLLAQRIVDALQNSQEDEATKQSADDILNGLEQLETIYNEFA